VQVLGTHEALDVSEHAEHFAALCRISHDCHGPSLVVRT
jgi:hypothetical protein